MIVPQPRAQIEEGLAESASFGTENCLEITELAAGPEPDYDLQQTWYPTLEDTQRSFQDGGPLEVPELSSAQDFQLSEYGIVHTTCDPPMSFRNRHRLLHGIYNCYPDPDLITAKDIGDVARKVGLLMEEVFSWFEDEKLRRAELLSSNQHKAQKSACLFPPSPESTRASDEVSSASPFYNAASPGKLSQPLDKQSSSLVSMDQRGLEPPKPKRGRPAKTHVKTEPDLSSPDAKRKKISVKYPCPDCGNFIAVERWAEHIDRKHFPENVWECPKINRRTGRPCSLNPQYRPSYRYDNFATHLKGEHNCPDSEVLELRRTCKFEVTDFFHNVCGFCDEPLGSRDQSIEHIKEHFRETSQQQNPPTDLGVSRWKEKCRSEHKLQLGIHYRRSHTLKTDPVDKNRDQDHDESEDGGSDKGKSDNGGHGSSEFPPKKNHHDHDHDEDRPFDKESFDNRQVYDFSNSKYYNFARSGMAEFTLDFPASVSYMPVPDINTEHTLSLYSGSSAVSQLSRNENSVKQGSQLPYTDPCGSTYPYPPPRRPSLASHQSYGSVRDDFSSEESKEKGRCSYPECGKLFKDLNAHMLTHQNERPEKCPILTCDYHIKGFARKYDKNRHTLTHYKGTMVCGFCPGSGSTAEKSFNRADVFKRHLTSVHGVELTPPGSRKNMLHSENIGDGKKLSGRAPYATGKCSTCSSIFSNSQDFYEHLDDCVLRVMQQETETAGFT